MGLAGADQCGDEQYYIIAQQRSEDKHKGPGILLDESRRDRPRDDSRNWLLSGSSLSHSQETERFSDLSALVCVFTGSIGQGSKTSQVF